MAHQNKQVSCIIPARDEEESIGLVIESLLQLKNAKNEPLLDKIVVCDNGSKDNTASIAQSYGINVIKQPKPGYGTACLTALTQVKGADIILFIDGDNAFRAEQAQLLIDSIANGIDLAIGSRSLGHKEKGALTLPQQFGNWLACHLIQLLWDRTVTDLGPFRAISQDALKKLDMKDRNFGWTIEMQIKAIQQGMMVVEHPVDTHCRLGHSKISGTVKGTIGAGIGILSMIAKLWLKQLGQKPYQQKQYQKPQNKTLTTPSLPYTPFSPTKKL